MIIEAHTHPFGFPSYRDLSDKIKTVADLFGFRKRYPELYNVRLTEPTVDFVDELIADMDQHGVDKAIIQGTGGSVSFTNEDVVAALNKHPDRLYGLFRLGSDQIAAGYPDDPKETRDAAPDQIAHCAGKLGLIGMGELFVRTFTSELHPEKIARDLQPMMEALAHYKVPVQIPTGWTQFPGAMYLADPIFTDEIAALNPDLPIILTKMGRGIEYLFEISLGVAMRNDNVYFDTVGTTAEHLSKAVRSIGADRIMFGTDWSPTWRCVRVPTDLYTSRLKTVQDAGLSDAETEQVLCKTAQQVFNLN